jgi:hypothetical protein
MDPRSLWGCLFARLEPFSLLPLRVGCVIMIDGCMHYKCTYARCAAVPYEPLEVHRVHVLVDHYCIGIHVRKASPDPDMFVFVRNCHAFNFGNDARDFHRLLTQRVHL